MLSYMIPVDTADKPPLAPQRPPTTNAATAHQTHLNLNLSRAQHPPNTHIQILTNGNGASASAAQATGVHRSCLVTNMSKDSSVNSFASDGTTGTGSSTSGAATPIAGVAAALGPMGHKNKYVVVTSNGGGGGHQQLVHVATAAKHHSLKRVSFGSSKGSMVETLIYESPLHEEPEPGTIPENGTPFPEDGDQTEDERERVRVSFVQHSKPQEVQLPDEPVILTDSEFMMAAAAIAESNHVITTYTRQESTESGWDNPFRPGGDLSREADEIVELIKGGKPITPTSATAPTITTTDGILSNVSHKSTASVAHESPAKQSNAHQSPAKNGSGSATAKNGGIEGKGGASGGTSAVNVQRGTTGQPGGNVEYVVLKKESKCECCVVQ